MASECNRQDTENKPKFKEASDVYTEDVKVGECVVSIISNNETEIFLLCEELINRFLFHIFVLEFCGFYREPLLPRWLKVLNLSGCPEWLNMRTNRTRCLPVCKALYTKDADLMAERDELVQSWLTSSCTKKILNPHCHNKSLLSKAVNVSLRNFKKTPTCYTARNYR